MNGGSSREVWKDWIRIMSPTCNVTIPVSLGELIDKVTILELKARRLRDETKLACAKHELSLLHEALFASLPERSPKMTHVTVELAAVNERLWDIEEEIRAHEKRQDFGTNFVTLARAVYLNNDRRAQLKAEINTLTGSGIHEVKSYV